MRSFEMPPEPRAARVVRLAAVAALACAFLLRLIAFRDHAVGFPACSFAIGLGLVVYGIATLFDETATFPKWLYAAIALVGAALSALWASRLFF